MCKLITKAQTKALSVKLNLLNFTGSHFKETKNTLETLDAAENKHKLTTFIAAVYLANLVRCVILLR